jgi:DnaJ domain
MSRDDAYRLAALAALGLPADASTAEIHSAYRRLARLSHPDTADDTAPGSDFAQVNAAYRLLTKGEGLSPVTEGEPHPATSNERSTTGTVGMTSLDVWSTQVGPDDPQLVAGPVIVRPLPPESR